MSRCTSCVYRGSANDTGTKERPGCQYIQHTGKSRLKEVYRALGVDHITKEVRKAMRPAVCTHYVRGDKRELKEKGLLLEGSVPYVGQKKQASPAPAPTEDAGKPKPQKAPKQKAGPKPKKVRKPPAWQERAQGLYEAGMTDPEIAEAVGQSTKSIFYWRKRNGMPSKRAPSRAGAYMPLYQEGMSDGEIAEATGRSRKSVQKWRQRMGLPYHPGGRQRKCAEMELRRRELCDQGMSDAEIAEAEGVKPCAVVAWRSRRGIAKNPVRAEAKRKEGADDAV